MLFSGKGLRVAGAALAAMVLWPATVVANVYQVTRSGTDGEGYTLATAIEAASASGRPATIEIMLFSVLVTETLIIDTPVQIQPGPHLDQADIHARLDGPLFDLRAGAEGSVFSHVGVYGDVPVTMPTSAFSVCANDLTFSGVYVGMFQQAFHLDCAAPLSLTIADSYLLKNGRQLSGELLPGSMIQVQGSTLEAPETVVDLQAPECGGAVMIEDSTFGEFFPGLVRDLNVAMVHLRGCLDAEFRSVTATDMGAFLKASPYEAGAGPTVLITNSLIQGAPALTLPIIDFEGQQLTLRHTSLTAGGVDAVAGNDLSFHTIGCQRQTAARRGEGVNVKQRHVHVGVAPFDRSTQNARAAAEVEQMASGQAIKVVQQQGRPTIQAAMAEHAGEADDFQWAAWHFDLEVSGKTVQLYGLGSFFHGDLPQLAMPGAVEFARATEGAELAGRRFDACAFFPHQK